MAHSPGGHRHARGLTRWGIPAWGLGAAVACGVAAVVAVAVGISQATASPACAAVSFTPAAARPATATLLAAARANTATRSGAAAAPGGGEATHYVLQPGTGNCSYPGLPAWPSCTSRCPPASTPRAPRAAATCRCPARTGR